MPRLLLLFSSLSSLLMACLVLGCALPWPCLCLWPYLLLVLQRFLVFLFVLLLLLFAYANLCFCFVLIIFYLIANEGFLYLPVFAALKTVQSFNKFIDRNYVLFCWEMPLTVAVPNRYFNKCRNNRSFSNEPCPNCTFNLYKFIGRN